MNWHILRASVIAALVPLIGGLASVVFGSGPFILGYLLGVGAVCAVVLVVFTYRVLRGAFGAPERSSGS